MFMPAVFHENLFDDFFDPFWNDGALERAMNREERETFGKRGANMMKTDVKQTADGNYDVAVDLPGCKKEDEGYGQICMGNTLGNLPGIRVDAAGQVYSQHKGVALMQTAYQPAGSKTGRPKCAINYHRFHKRVT